MKSSQTLVAVCGRCRAPMGEGSTAVVYAPRVYRRFAEAAGARVYDDDDPVMVCRPCAAQINATLAQLTPQ